MRKYVSIDLVGFNDNPTAQQFEAAYRKLLIHNDVISSIRSNCVDRGIKTLTVSSRKKGKQMRCQTDGSSADSLDTFFSGDDIADNLYAPFYLDDHIHSLAYIASMLESKIIKAKKNHLLKCNECLDVFFENELI